MDAKSGQTLYDNHADKALPIASLSKMMTLYLTSQAINSGKLHWSDKVSVDKHLIKMSKSYALGTFKIKRSKQYTVKDLYQAALIASSNSAAIALGNAVSGSNAKFIKLMNHQAKAWHLNANFISSSGLDNTDLRHYNYQLPNTTKKQQNLVSAKAISVVAQHLISVFPQISKWSDKATYDIGNQTLVNANALLKPGAYYRASNHMTGLKTGYTETAGLCLTVTYWRNGRELIATILGSDTTFSAMNGLITHLDKTLSNKTITEKATNITIGGKKVVTEPAETTTKVWYRNGTDASKIKVTDQLAIKTLPVKKGQRVTTTAFKNTGLPSDTDLGHTAKKTVKVTRANQGKPGGNWFTNFFSSIGKTLDHIFS